MSLQVLVSCKAPPIGRVLHHTTPRAPTVLQASLDLNAPSIVSQPLVQAMSTQTTNILVWWEVLLVSVIAATLYRFHRLMPLLAGEPLGRRITGSALPTTLTPLVEVITQRLYSHEPILQELARPRGLPLTMHVFKSTMSTELKIRAAIRIPVSYTHLTLPTKRIV